MSYVITFDIWEVRIMSLCHTCEEMLLVKVLFLAIFLSTVHLLQLVKAGSIRGSRSYQWFTGLNRGCKYVFDSVPITYAFSDHYSGLAKGSVLFLISFLGINWDRIQEIWGKKLLLSLQFMFLHMVIWNIHFWSQRWWCKMHHRKKRHFSFQISILLPVKAAWSTRPTHNLGR